MEGTDRGAGHGGTDANGLEILSVAECRELLIGSHLGRVALASEGQLVVFPVNFVVERDTIYVRTGAGRLLREAVAGHLVAFEVDAADPTYQTGWSVLVVGAVRRVQSPSELSAVRRLPLRPWGPGDKAEFVAIDVHSMTGRRIMSLPREGWHTEE